MVTAPAADDAAGRPSVPAADLIRAVAAAIEARDLDYATAALEIGIVPATLEAALAGMSQLQSRTKLKLEAWLSGDVALPNTPLQTRHRPSSGTVEAEIGSRIRSIRLAKGLSRAQLGAAIHVSPVQIRTIEIGNSQLPIRRLIDIARVLAVPLDDLCGTGTAPSTASTEARLRHGRAASLLAALPEAQRLEVIRLIEAMTEAADADGRAGAQRPKFGSRGTGEGQRDGARRGTHRRAR